MEIKLKDTIGLRDPMLFGHFIEHFHRQIYGGIYDPGNPLSDKHGFRLDVIEAMKKITVPILRWPGGCFVSAYHWKEAVGETRTPMFDKAWRVEDPNTFGTDEFILFCKKIDAKPYICTNAGTGTPEEMSDWVEYCNLESEGKYAKWRIKNGYPNPHKVKYWSIGNENYGAWEIGAKTAKEWARLVAESAKMMQRADPLIELSAAALPDVNWNLELLTHAGKYLDWISIHGYWDNIHQDNNYANYEQVMAYTEDLEAPIRKVRGLLMALGLEKSIRISFDEWNLRGWYHPNSHNVKVGVTKEDYLYPRDKNDDNTKYTMADAVFSACFLNVCLRNCDIVGMANFAPIVNTRGCIFTYPEGIVLRSTYFVFDMYANLLGDVVLESKSEDKQVDIIATKFSDGPGLAVAAVNKDMLNSRRLTYPCGSYRVHTLNGDSADAYNDVKHAGVNVKSGKWIIGNLDIELEPHSVNIIEIKE